MRLPNFVPTTLVVVAVALSLGWNVTRLVTQTVIQRGDGATQTTTRTTTSRGTSGSPGFWLGLRIRTGR